jgi:hypothetical protein
VTVTPTPVPEVQTPSLRPSAPVTPQPEPLPDIETQYDNIEEQKTDDNDKKQPLPSYVTPLVIVIIAVVVVIAAVLALMALRAKKPAEESDTFDATDEDFE